MKIKLKQVSLLIVFLGVCHLVFISVNNSKNIEKQNNIISSVFEEKSDISFNDYLGYIYIPKFNIKRLIKYGTDKDILDEEYVGMHRLSGDLHGNDLIILAGHNTSNVFKSLHQSDVGDYIFIDSKVSRKYVIYDKKIVNDDDFSYLLDNRMNELLLITCTNKKGERLLVFLKEDK